MAAERSMGVRALPIPQQRRLRLIMSDPNSSERDTDQAPEDAHSDGPITVPPPPRLPTELGSPVVPSESDSLEPPGYDPDKWEHYKIARMVESLGVVRAGLAAVSPSAQEALIAKVANQVATEVTNRFRPVVEAAERRIMGEVNALTREHRRTNDDVTDLRRQMTDFERRLSELEQREGNADPTAPTR